MAGSLIQSRRAIVMHGSRLLTAPGWEQPLAAMGLRAGDDWRSLSPGLAVAASSITNAFRVELDDGHTVYFKRYVYPAESDRMYWMVPSKAVIEAWGYHQLQSLGIPVPEVLAVGEIRRFGRVRTACIVTLEIAGSMNLEQYAELNWRQCTPRQRWSEALAVADYLLPQLRQAHQDGFFHYDLKWRNILVCHEEGVLRTTWIDCPRARRSRAARPKGRLVDLAALARLATAYFTPRQQRKLLARYLQLPAEDKEVGVWMRRIAAYLARRLPEHLKR